jgi:hypothetical protein
MKNWNTDQDFQNRSNRNPAMEKRRAVAPRTIRAALMNPRLR